MTTNTNKSTSKSPQIRLANIAAIKAHNRSTGHHFFDPDTMRFFSSRVLNQVWTLPDGSALFITSEKAGFDDPTRRYTIRRANLDGTIDTVGENEWGRGFLAHATAEAAKNIARRIQANTLTGQPTS